jgi:hypothetical protein
MKIISTMKHAECNFRRKCFLDCPVRIALSTVEQHSSSQTFRRNWSRRFLLYDRDFDAVHASWHSYFLHNHEPCC